MDNKPSPKQDDHALTREIVSLFKQDLSAEQISVRLGVSYPDRKERRASTEYFNRVVLSSFSKRIGKKDEKDAQVACRVAVRASSGCPQV
jgi:hypothetical protein